MKKSANVPIDTNVFTPCKRPSRTSARELRTGPLPLIAVAALEQIVGKRRSVYRQHERGRRRALRDDPQRVDRSAEPFSESDASTGLGS